MIQTGERAPDFVLPSRGVPTRFYGIAGGRPVALVFCGPESLDLVSRYADRAGPDATVVAVTSGGGDGERAFPVLVDGAGAVLRRHFPRRPDDVNELPDRVSVEPS